MVAGGQRAGGYARGAPLRQQAPAPVAASTAISPPVPAAGGGGCQGGGTERAWEADQTLSTKGVRSLSEAASPRWKGGWGLRLLGDFLGFTEDDPERRRLPTWWRTGKKLARAPCYSATSPKGQRSPERFREDTGAGVCTSLPKCQEYGIKVRHTHWAWTPRV